MKEIIIWLSELNDYKKGVDLYCKYGNSATMKRILTRTDESKKNWETLKYELGKIAI